MSEFYFTVANVLTYENKELTAPNGSEPTLYYERDGRGQWDVRKIPTFGEILNNPRGTIVYHTDNNIDLASYLNYHQIKP